MSHFLGTHQNRLDAKGRVSVPAAFRAALRQDGKSVGLVLRPSHKLACIEAWPTPTFDALAARLQGVDPFSDEYGDLVTAIYADAYPLDVDKEGRVLLPEALVAHAGLTDSVAFMGTGASFQIWEPAAAEQRRADVRARTRIGGMALPAAVSA